VSRQRALAKTGVSAIENIPGAKLVMIGPRQPHLYDPTRPQNRRTSSTITTKKELDDGV
jgi:hypothetical protein